MKLLTEQEQNVRYMQEALKEAKKAYDEQEVPVCCVIVYQGKIIARAHNKRVQNKSALDHAETLAIKKACKKLQTWILEDAVMYITLEPCIMCAGAILQARIKKVYFGTTEPKFGAVGSLIDVFSVKGLNHYVEVQSGILQDECQIILRKFFQNMRVDKKQKK